MNRSSVRKFLLGYWIKYIRNKIDLDEWGNIPAYKEYVSSVSTDDMACSLEVIHFACKLSDYFNKKRILDLGSGISSYSFRTYMTYHPEIEVVSVDDDKAWLDKTINFLRNKNVSTENFFLWDQFKEREDSFDLLFYDLGNMQTRAENLELILDRFFTKQSFLIVDDIHKTYYRTFVREIVSKRKDLIFCSLKYLTSDKYNRYSGLIFSK